MEEQNNQTNQNIQPNKTEIKEPLLHDDGIQTLIPTKNKPALLSYYFGIAGLVPILGLLFSILAIVYGKKGLKIYSTNPTPGAKGHSITGMVLGIIQLIAFVLFVLFLIVNDIRQ